MCLARAVHTGPANATNARQSIVMVIVTVTVNVNVKASDDAKHRVQMLSGGAAG